MRNLNIMIKPASSLCNMRCKYCFYADVSSMRETFSYGLMTKETTELILNNIFCDLQPGDHINFAFQGGEPTLAGLSYFENFISYIDKIKNGTNVSYSLQTNALLIDDNWCKFLKKNTFLVGVSLDGSENIHNFCRVDADGHGTYRRVMNSILLLKEFSVDFNILMTLTSNLARHPNQVWNLIKSQNFRFVQFTPCLSPLDDSKDDKFAITPQRFADFYTQIFRLWKKEFENGNYFSIKLFDDLINLLAFGHINACGLNGKCSLQVVIEANGNVFPCDFYTLDNWCSGNLTIESLSHIYTSSVNIEFLNRSRTRLLCPTCKYNNICNGTCERMHSLICYPEGTNSCGYATLLNSIINDLVKIAENERTYRKQTDWR